MRCSPHAVYVAVVHGRASRGGSCAAHHAWKARKALALAAPVTARPGRYRPTDKVLAFLDRL
ncbi:hypothetical protein ACFXB3_10285 [Streptomyces sp. NPDC059447]|uniref:hypothetical protein n=1 Tax=Streptomyces sp. NPDC059447 TaxID=3346834 RepID=UPI00369FCD80